MMGGATASVGGFVFTGEGNVWFKTYDAKTGKVLWQYQCGAGVNAAPSVFSVDGEQFVAVAAGGNFQPHFPRGHAVVQFRTPKAGSLLLRRVPPLTSAGRQCPGCAQS